MNLGELQKNFQSYILQNDSRIEKNIAPSKNLSSSQQIQIYQNGYYERIVSAMTQDFPIMLAMLGENAFSSLVRDYISHYPSDDFNLRYIGKNLSVFIISKDSSFIAYSELAKLEFLMCVENSLREINFESNFNVMEVYNAFHVKGKLIALNLNRSIAPPT